MEDVERIADEALEALARAVVASFDGAGGVKVATVIPIVRVPVA